MKIFKELKKLGYKHYTEHTIEELDNLHLNSEERITEQALVLRWFRGKYFTIGYIVPRNGKYTYHIVSNIIKLEMNGFKTSIEIPLIRFSI